MKELGHTTESTRITQKQTTKYTKVKKQVQPGAKRCEEKLCKLIERMCERSDSWQSGEIDKIAENGNEWRVILLTSPFDANGSPQMVGRRHCTCAIRSFKTSGMDCHILEVYNFQLKAQRRISELKQRKAMCLTDTSYLNRWVKKEKKSSSLWERLTTASDHYYFKQRV